MSEINVPLLRKVMEHIEAHPQEWDQGMWVTGVRTLTYTSGEVVKTLPMHTLPYHRDEPPAFCGTAFCFAGHVANMTGWNPIWRGTHFDRQAMHHPVHGDGDVETLARVELGITMAAAEALFNANNEMFHLKQIVAALIEAAEEE